MANPLVHAIVVMIAILIPGGLLVYMAWRAHKSRLKGKSQHTSVKPPTPFDATAAFMAMYPPLSLRAQSRRARLDRIKAFKSSKQRR